MAAQKKSIDEIWKELNARPAPRPRTQGELAPGSIQIPGLGVIKRVPPPAKPALPKDEPMEDVAIGSAGPQRPAGVPGYDPQQAGVSAEEVTAYQASIQRLVNCLSDTDRSTRRQAAATLLTKLTKGDASTPAASPQMLQALVCGPLLSPLLALLRDQVEQCRVTAVSLWSHIVNTVSDVSPLAPAPIPELARRMGHLPVQEQAEEVRLALVQLVTSLVGRCPPTLLQSALTDLVLVLCRAQEDSYHEIKKAGAAATATLARTLPHGALLPHDAKLATGLVASLAHPHSRVRVASLEAMDTLAATGALAAQTVHDLIAPGLRPVAYDRTPAVREALFGALARWLGGRTGDGTAMDSTSAATGSASASAPSPSQLPQPTTVSPLTMTDLLPILLTGVSDPQPSVATLALNLVESVGTAYEASQTATTTQADAPATAPTTAPTSEPMQVDGEAGAGESVSGPGVDVCVAACQLGPPYTGRPGAGARAMARALLSALLPPVIGDLTAWTVSQRAAAVRSLHTLLVLAEDSAQAHVTTLLPALCTAVSDEDVDIAACVVRCAHVVGAYVAPTRWLPLALDHLANARLSAAARANGLVVLSALLYAAGTARQPLPADALRGLADTLASDDLRAALLHAAPVAAATAATLQGSAAAAAAAAPAAAAPSEAAATRTQLLAVTSNLLRWQGPACAAVSAQVLTVLLALWGAESTGGSPMTADSSAAAAAASSTGVAAGPAVARRAAVEQVMQQLVGSCGAGSVQELLNAHAEQQLGSVLTHMDTWTPGSGGFLVLRALLLTSGKDTLARLSPTLLLALKPLLSDPEGQPTLRLAVLQLLDQVLDCADGRGAGLAAGDAGAALLLDAALLTPLTWRAGKTAAAIRYAAVTALASCLRRGLLPAKPVLRLMNDNTLWPLIAQELDEDWYVDVRHMTCYVVQHLMLLVGAKLSHDTRRAVYTELLKRLDDSSDTVRIAACEALQAFCSTLPKDYCETNTGYLAAGVVIHMDDADVRIQEAACQVLVTMGRVKPDATAVEVLKVRDRFRNKHLCERVIQACGEAATGQQPRA